MPAINLILDGKGAFADVDPARIDAADPRKMIAVAVLDHGMASGLPSVAIRLDLPDGRVVVAETNARLFVTAAKVIEAKYPNLFDAPAKGN